MTVNMPRGRRRRDAFGAWKSPFALLALLAFAGAAAGWPADLRGPVSATAPASLGVVLLLTAPAKGRAGAMACSGTAITRDLIVTAAHCLAGRGNVTIVRSVNRTSVLEPAAATYVHPNFYRTDDKVPKNDIAFVRSASPLEEPQMLLNMDAADHLDDIGVHSTTCGFGQNNDVVSMDGTTPMNALETKAAPMLVVNDRPSPATGRLNGISAALSYGLAVLGVHVALV
ncbi:hypothetical protein DFJ74DRAFT_705508 [Hyaloraphidium curvatum]|nr:hypothetical protein DFJ74DRAFT_705508 [Hyaloraphidium curvatum]